MSDSCYDLAGTPIEALRADLTRLRKTRGGMRVSDGPSARRFSDITQDIRDLEAELDRRTK